MVNSKIYRRDDRQDCKQFVAQELVKLYKNKCKYRGKSDWKKVVKTTICRRADDYRVIMLRESSRYFTENRITKEDEDYPKLESLATTLKDRHGAQIWKTVVELIKESDEFTSWDREYIETISEMEDGNLSDSNVAWHMGYDKEGISEFHSNIKKFRKKLKKYGDKI